MNSYPAIALWALILSLILSALVIAFHKYDKPIGCSIGSCVFFLLLVSDAVIIIVFFGSMLAWLLCPLLIH